ncbi:CBS domain-containing protein [Streptomyces sp. CC228A]|uniref:CBS domain-containing protein n=1 Tax=Streptomyces sp. CC228A TaxID=2898186 RepID=UPI0035A81E50
MTVIQAPHRPAAQALLRPALQAPHRPACTASTPAQVHGEDAVDETGPQVWEDMTVEVALSVMSGARAAHLTVRDDDGSRTGLVSRAQLTAFRATPAYTDRVRLRDLPSRADGPHHP